jgi:hypothetical protein
MRVRRGNLKSEKDPDGRVHVWVNVDASETKPRLDSEPSVLISAKDETIRVLSEQLESEREARRRADTIIARLTQTNAALAGRVPELEVQSDKPEQPPPRSSAGAQDDSEGRKESRWRRLFEG